MNLFQDIDQIDHNLDTKSILEQTKLNWDVEKRKLFTKEGLETPYYGIFRSDNNYCLNTTKDQYTPFQNSELAEMLIRISEKTGYELHNGGQLSKGGKVYLQLKSPNNIDSIGESKTQVKGFLTGVNSHDGTTSLQWGEVNITIICMNTFRYAINQMQNNRITHSKDIHKRVDIAIGNIDAVLKQELQLFNKYKELAEQPVTKELINQVVKNITKVDSLIDPKEFAANYSTYAINRYRDLNSSIQQQMLEHGKTKWGLFSGVTHYTNYQIPGKGIQNLYIGSGYKINNETLALL